MEDRSLSTREVGILAITSGPSSSPKGRREQRAPALAVHGGVSAGIAQVGHDKPLAGIGNAVGTFASNRGYTLIQNLTSHGVGKVSHESPEEVPTWPTKGDKRRMHNGLVLTVEPFLSCGGMWATSGADDDWTLYSPCGEGL